MSITPTNTPWYVISPTIFFFLKKKKKKKKKKKNLRAASGAHSGFRDRSVIALLPRGYLGDE